MTTLYVLIACILSAIAYRAGGMSKDDNAKPTWIPKWMRLSVTRDIGCSLVLLGLTVLIFGHSGIWWAYLLYFGLSWAALSTYWDWLFGYDNYFMHGLGCSLAAFPLLWCGVEWNIFVTRAIICTLGMGVWSMFIDKDYIEEEGRGVFFII